MTSPTSPSPPPELLGPESLALKERFERLTGHPLSLRQWLGLLAIPMLIEAGTFAFLKIAVDELADLEGAGESAPPVTAGASGAAPAAPPAIRWWERIAPVSPSWWAAHFPPVGLRSDARTKAG